MMSPRSMTGDSLPTLTEGTINSESSKLQPVQPLPHRFDRQSSNPIITALSPPPLSKTKPRRKNQRLRSDSGLGLHTNQPGFRQHTEYSSLDSSAHGRPRNSRAQSFDENSSLEDFSLGHLTSPDLEGFVSNGKNLPDFFEPAVIKLAFSNPVTVQRLRKFAETRHDGSDIDFLLKVEEYSRALGTLISSMSYISSHFTGTTAVTPLGLPLDVASTLRSNIKTCARTALPALDKVYQDAKSTAEKRLSQNLYPEFVKYQLAQCLTASLSTTRPLTGVTKTPYPGLGDAFCLTDPLRPDNPVVFASDGLLSLSGFQREELVGKNCRLLQGIATDAEAVCRLSRAIAAGREATELILNYHPDGTPYWNLLFICPLMENGIVRYLLGAQVNVSDNMGTDYKDILAVLNFGRPPEDFHPLRSLSSPASTDWSARQSTENLALSQTDDDKPPSRRRRFFRRFRRKSPPSRASSPSQQGSTASLPATDDSAAAPLSPPRGHPLLSSPRLDHHFNYNHNHTRPYKQHLDEHSTPYSRLLILRYNPNPSSSQPTKPRNTPLRNTSTTTNNKSQLPVAFATPAALSLLNLRPHEAHAVLERDVFAVLAAQLGSPSVNRVLRREVAGAVGKGEGVVRDLMAPLAGPGAGSAGGAGATGGLGGGGEGGVGGTGVGVAGAGAGAVGGGVRAGMKGSKSVAAAGGTDGDGVGTVYGDVRGAGESRPKLGGTLDRGAEFFSQVLFPSSSAASGSGGKGQLRRVVSSWVPLKDGEGKVRWVVVVLTPVEGSG